MDSNITGKKIAELRKQKGMTQQELADKVGVTNKAVSKWERGLNFPDISIMGDLAEALGTDVADLMESEEEQTKSYKLFLIIPMITGGILIALTLMYLSLSDGYRMALFVLQAFTSVGMIFGILVNKDYIWDKNKQFDTDNILIPDLLRIKDAFTGEYEGTYTDKHALQYAILVVIFVMESIGANFIFLEGTGKLGYYMACAAWTVFFIQYIDHYDKKGKKRLINYSFAVLMIVADIAFGLLINPELY